MFETVKQIREVFGPISTTAFVIIMFLAFGSMGAGIGWMVDKSYKHQSAKNLTLPASTAAPMVQQESGGPGSPNVQGVNGDVTITVDQSNSATERDHKPNQKRR